jgi:hypothetical protein
MLHSRKPLEILAALHVHMKRSLLMLHAKAGGTSPVRLPMLASFSNSVRLDHHREWLLYAAAPAVLVAVVAPRAPQSLTSVARRRSAPTVIECSSKTTG